MAVLFIGLVIGTVGLCWFVHRTFYRSEYGNRPWLAFGCTAVVWVVCVIVGIYLLAWASIGGAVG